MGFVLTQKITTFSVADIIIIRITIITMITVGVTCCCGFQIATGQLFCCNCPSRFIIFLRDYILGVKAFKTLVLHAIKIYILDYHKLIYTVLHAVSDWTFL